MDTDTSKSAKPLLYLLGFVVAAFFTYVGLTHMGIDTGMQQGASLQEPAVKQDNLPQVSVSVGDERIQLLPLQLYEDAQRRTFENIVRSTNIKDERELDVSSEDLGRGDENDTDNKTE